VTLVDGTERGAGVLDDPPKPGILRRLWGAPAGAHVAALALVLIALLPVIGTDASFSADEGAAIVQAQSLAQGRGWIVEHPLPEVDPDTRYHPIELSAKGPDGIAPFAKHPLYALAMAAAGELGGVTAMVLLSLLGTTVAAAATAALAGRLHPSLSRPAVWTVGLASPLLFDGYLVIAHAMGAAVVSLTALAAVTAFERRSARLALLAAPLLVAAVLLRTEATLLAVALACVAAVLAARHRTLRRPGLVLAAGALGAAAAGRLIERVWAGAIVGGTVSVSGPGGAEPFGFVEGRIHAAVLTWLRPSYDGPAALDAALLVMLAGIALGAFVGRRRPQDRAGIVLGSVLAVSGALTGVLLVPKNLVPGLLVAFPLAAAGLFLVTRRTVETTTAQLLLGTFALFSVAVLATQYAVGGTAEWGGRYFAIGLPLVVPVALLALRQAAARIGPDAARPAAAALVACSLMMGVMSVASVRATHRFTATLMTQIDSAGQAQGVDRPVMVATQGAIPRLAWKTYDRQRWLLVPPADLAGVMARLRDHGVARVTLVTREPSGEPPALGDGVRVAGTTPTPGNGWVIQSLSTG
jgi:hypothetical protein